MYCTAAGEQAYSHAVEIVYTKLNCVTYSGQIYNLLVQDWVLENVEYYYIDTVDGIESSRK